MIDNKRKSGIELLRIISALFVIILHYNDKFAFGVECIALFNKTMLYFLESISICAVDVFILISGYFMFNSNHRTINKIIKLIIPVIVFKLFYYLAFCFIYKKNLIINDFISCLIPNNYYVVLYIVLFLISPYLNKLLLGLSNKEWFRFICVIIVLFSIYPTVVDLMEEILNKEVFGISTITAWGNFQGFNIINFILLYCLGAFIKCNQERNMVSFSKTFCIIMYFISILVIFIWSLLNDKISTHGLRSAWCYHNTIVILNSICLFYLFKDINISSSVINLLAKSSFTCYLIHSYFLNYFKIEVIVQTNIFQIFAHCIVTAVLIYLLSFFVFILYEKTVGRLLDLLPNKEIKLLDI